ncbi:sperm flagellar protein 1 isoform X2 [Drosophila mauritiana]|uniref:Sperm flagellar protein 1 isoform X2 n=1 Tax=Drosophila mauritiana TaxID=7226 RepID=A0A6P8KTY3_DROMA|nr:sperm flagellar protein 1 isoform X2 [Drosophila mauritiana]
MHTVSGKNLSSEELEEVSKWLEQNNISTQRLRREFSDVLPLAEIFKRDYPRLVDLFNYPKKSSVQLKLANWETFNFRVLSKLNMTLTKDFMEQMANGVSGAAEVLVHEVIRLEKRQRLAEERNATLRQERLWEENDEVKTVVVNKQVGDGIVQVPQKMILYSLYEKSERDSHEKDAIIDAYQQRMTHMESIIKLKTERIDELLMQMGKPPQKRATSSATNCFLAYDGNNSLIQNHISPTEASSPAHLDADGFNS